jgi:hypothetical protein
MKQAIEIGIHRPKCMTKIVPMQVTFRCLLEENGLVHLLLKTRRKQESGRTAMISGKGPGWRKPRDAATLASYM